MKKLPIRPRTVLLATMVVVLVVVLPAITILRDRLGAGKESERAEEGTPFDAGTVYEVRQLFSMPVGRDARSVAISGSDVTLETLAPSANGTFLLVDHPAALSGEARLRWLDAEGKVISSFQVEPGITLFTPGVGDSDLWADLSSSSERQEYLIHYDRSGKQIGRFDLPPGFLVRNICLAPNGEVWAQSEEWQLDPEGKNAVYASYLLPVVDASGTAVAGAIDKAEKGSFIGADGWHYELKGENAAQDVEYPAFTVVARDPGSDAIRTYRLPKGLKPYAADKDGRIYCEARMPTQPRTFGIATLGDAAEEVSLVRVFDEKGLVSVIPMAWPQGVNSWYPTAYAMPDGRLFASRWEDNRLLAIEMKPTERHNRVADAEPSKPEARVLVTTGMPYSGDPYLAEDVAQRDLWQLVYSGLVARDASMTAVPDLAEAVPTPGQGVSANGLAVEWRIREGREWHDGKPVTAQDVVATWEYLRSLSTVSRPQPFPGFDLITQVEADGDVVRVSLSEPFGPAPEAFFPFVLPKHVLESAKGTTNGGPFGAPVGSGPYRLDRWETEGRWLLSNAGDAQVERLEIDFIEADAASDDYMSSPMPTLWTWMKPTEATTVRRDAVGTVMAAPTGRWWGSILNASAKPTDEAAVRQALSTVHPVEQIRDYYGVDASTAAAAGPFAGVGTGLPASTDETAAVQSALAKLRTLGYSEAVGKLLDASGRQMSLRYELTVDEEGLDQLLAEQVDAVISEWTRLGIDGRWNYSRPWFYSPVNSAGYLSTGAYQVGAGVFPGFIDPAWGSIFDPSDTPSWSNPRGLSVTFTSDEELTRLHDQARASANSEERTELGRKISERADELGLFVLERPEVRENAVLGIEGYRPGPYPAGDFWNAREWTIEKRP